MSHIPSPSRSAGARRGSRARTGWVAALAAAGALVPASARASLLSGETLDTVADVMTWVVLVLAPVIGIVVFLMIHILPEKIAEKRQHPQVAAIQCLCLLSLVFGGMLWPFAWLWAYSKPVLYKLAYGTDQVAHGAEHPAQPAEGDAEELGRLRSRIAELEAKQGSKSAAAGGKA